MLRAHDDATHDQHVHAARAHAPEEIIGSVSKGLYCRNFGGGQVDITSGKFVFSASEAYLIENGQITRPVQGRDADRQRPRRHDAHVDGRQRSEARRRRRHLRQGRPGRAGRRRPADPARRRLSRSAARAEAAMWLPRPSTKRSPYTSVGGGLWSCFRPRRASSSDRAARIALVLAASLS